MINTRSGDFVSGLIRPPIAISGAATAQVGRMHVCSGSSYTVTLPTAVGNGDREMSFRMASGLTGFATLDGAGSETIDGALTRVMWKQESCTLISDNVNWFKKDGVSKPLICFMRMSTFQASVPNVTETTMLLDSADTDNSGMMATVGSNRMDIPRTSTYDLAAFIMCDNGTPTAATRWICSINRDPNTGTFATLLQREVSIASGSYSGAAPIGFGIPLTVLDKLNMSLYQNSGGAVTVYGNSTGAASNMSLKEVPIW